MSHRIKKRSKKAGLEPGTLVYVGDEKKDNVSVELFEYDKEGVTEKSIPVVDCAAHRETPGVTWLNIDGIHDTTVVERIGKDFGLHPLTLEDIANTDQRPKMEDYVDYAFIVLKMLRCQEGQTDIITEQVSIVLGRNFVLSFQQGIEGDVFSPVRERIRSAKGRICHLGPDYLCYALIDSIIDNYFVILENIGEQVEDLELELVANPNPATLQAIHHLKRELIFLRKSVWPLREVIGGMQRYESDLIAESTQVYLRDIYDHTIQVIDTLETYRDMLSGMIDMYMSSISNKMNEVMKVLTIIATIFIPLTFIAGVYGMNFENFPELKWPYGYLYFWIVMIAISLTMLLFFRRKKWL
jgi:magnesium transporter